MTPDRIGRLGDASVLGTPTTGIATLPQGAAPQAILDYECDGLPRTMDLQLQLIDASGLAFFRVRWGTSGHGLLIAQPVPPGTWPFCAKRIQVEIVPSMTAPIDARVCIAPHVP